MNVDLLISAQLFPHLMSDWNTKIIDKSYPAHFLAHQICETFSNPTFLRQHQFQIQSLGHHTNYQVVFTQALRRPAVPTVQYLIEVSRGDDQALDRVCHHWMGQDWAIIGPVMGVLIFHQYEAMLSQLLDHIKHCNHLTIAQDYHHQWMASILFSTIRLQQENNFDQLLTHVLQHFQSQQNEHTVFAPALRESARHLNAHAAQQTLSHVGDLQAFVSHSQECYKAFCEHHIDWLLQWVDDQSWQNIMQMHPSLLMQEHSAQRQHDLILAAVEHNDRQSRGKKRM